MWVYVYANVILKKCSKVSSRAISLILQPPLLKYRTVLKSTNILWKGVIIYADADKQLLNRWANSFQ